MCIYDGKYERDYIENYCWTMGLYIFDYEITDQGIYISANGSFMYPTQYNYIAYGVGTNYARNPKIFMRYYQWIVLFLFGQAMFFYFPSYLWKVFENARMVQLCENNSKFFLII